MNPKYSMKLLLLITVFFFLCCSNNTSAKLPEYKTMFAKGSNYEGAIFNPTGERAKASGACDATTKDVAKFESALVAYLKSTTQIKGRSLQKATKNMMDNLSKYKRQYYCGVRGSQKYIHADFFCDTMGFDWKKDKIEVMDGGDCFFGVEYDLKTGKFFNFYVNGEA
ncbi:MAG: hypothetical protein HN337_04650 [Deltaproteobacteria bacterium]|jgi:hypothetical protein|nr:hypothetical protein [Deltaproteobacteria bacterium]